MRLVARRDDLPQLRTFLRDRAATLLSGAAGNVELVGTLTRRLPAELMGIYLGVPGPDIGTLQLWARELFREIFTNLANDPAITGRALELAEQMRRYVDELIQERRSKPDGNTVLDRLLSLQLAGRPCLDDLTIRHNLSGLVAGAIDTTSKAVVHIVDTLLDRADVLAEARAAALSDDIDVLAAYCFEALRLKPQNSMLVRICECDAIIAAATPRETEITAGKMVFVATSSAMLDSDVLRCPEEFALDRPDYTALHFGVGLHACFGRHINYVQIVEQVRAILRLPDLRRAEGEVSRIRYDGPFPDVFHVSAGSTKPCL
jgi:cytochrome P450